MTDRVDPRPESNLIEKVAAAKVALASTDLSEDPSRTLAIIQWLFENEPAEVSRGAVPTNLFIAGIKATERELAAVPDA